MVKKTGPMIIDLLIGAAWFLVGLIFGFDQSSWILFLAAFFLDADILINEFIRIFIKKEKKFGFGNFLDEKSYTHRFLPFHLPVIILPTVFLIGFFWQGIIFGILMLATVFSHLVHDTVDKNFDGICWLWPFTKNSYKLRKIGWESRSRLELVEEAKRKKKRNTSQILRDNKT